MDDLISRQAAISAILHNEEVYSNHFGNDPIDKYTIAIIDNDAQTLAQLPTIDPVKHGRWLPEGKYACRCSNCGRAINNRLAASYKFCPECGEKKDKKEE